MNIAVGLDDVYEGELVNASEAGPAPSESSSRMGSGSSS
jgi:hypothetical protein